MRRWGNPILIQFEISWWVDWWDDQTADHKCKGSTHSAGQTVAKRQNLNIYVRNEIPQERFEVNKIVDVYIYI